MLKREYFVCVCVLAILEETDSLNYLFWYAINVDTVSFLYAMYP